MRGFTSAGRSIRCTRFSWGICICRATARSTFEGLVLTQLKNDPGPLRPVTRDLFAGDVGKTRFTRDAQGKVDGVLLTTGRVVDLKFERVTTTR
jgi:hypothetical protein